jgi:hypothetical protein
VCHVALREAARRGREVAAEHVHLHRRGHLDDAVRGERSVEVAHGGHDAFHVFSHLVHDGNVAELDRRQGYDVALDQAAAAERCEARRRRRLCWGHPQSVAELREASKGALHPPLLNTVTNF